VAVAQQPQLGDQHVDRLQITNDDIEHFHLKRKKRRRGRRRRREGGGGRRRRKEEEEEEEEG
jgi:hypothetical protein